MYYLKLNGTRLDIYEDAEGGVDSREEQKLGLSIVNDNYSMEQMIEMFSNLDSITIYGCVVQEDGRETDEYVAKYFEGYSVLNSVTYELQNDYYKIWLAKPTELEERLNEIEDTINYLLMEG